ncbi:MAG: hypothetical protein JXA07_07705 [Spirochaetes bacterium]|nr:hypothetical protein [Spirochaetota bacterium]
MNSTGNILARIPLFRHCLEEEIARLQKIGKTASVKKGHRFDMKKVNSFHVVINGIFEIEAMGKTDIVYLAPGSYFGALPFTENRQIGKVSALVDSTLMTFAAEDLYRFFLMSYKCLRGYLKIIGRTGLEISGVGKKYFGGATRIITVYSPYPQSGKSFLAALMGTALARKGKTAVLDVSFSGSSVFNFFEKKVPAPLAHRTEETPAFEQLINERMEHVGADLDLLNIAFGSKVRVNADIISPILFMLSKEYRYIVIDCGNVDEALRDRLFGVTDGIFTLLKSTKDTRLAYDLFDDRVKEGQRVYYVVNERYAGEVRNFPGGLVLPKFDAAAEEGEFARLGRCAEAGGLAPLLALATKKRRALVFETNLLNSLFYGGFLGALHKSGAAFDIQYASSYGYIVMALSAVSDSWTGFRKSVSQFFSEDRLNKLLDVTFPDTHVFKNHAALKLAAELCGDSRIEMFRQTPMAMLASGGLGSRRLFSTGNLADIAAASFTIYPIFEEVSITGSAYNSGYPDFRARVEDLFRIDVDETAYVSVSNSAAMGYGDGKLMSFFSRYLSCMEEKAAGETMSDLSDFNMVIDVSEGEMKIDRILDSSREISDRLLKKITLS